MTANGFTTAANGTVSATSISGTTVTGTSVTGTTVTASGTGNTGTVNTNQLNVKSGNNTNASITSAGAASVKGLTSAGDVTATVSNVTHNLSNKLNSSDYDLQVTDSNPAADAVSLGNIKFKDNGTFKDLDEVRLYNNQDTLVCKSMGTGSNTGLLIKKNPGTDEYPINVVSVTWTNGIPAVNSTPVGYIDSSGDYHLGGNSPTSLATLRDSVIKIPYLHISTTISNSANIPKKVHDNLPETGPLCTLGTILYKLNKTNSRYTFLYTKGVDSNHVCLFYSQTGGTLSSYKSTDDGET